MQDLNSTRKSIIKYNIERSLLHEKVRELRKSFHSKRSGDPDRLSIDRDAMVLEKKMVQIEIDIDKLCETILYISLRYIDYREHKRLFTAFMLKSPIGAFLLHGSSRRQGDKPYSVSLLLERLMDTAADELMVRKRYDFATPGNQLPGSIVQNLWRFLAEDYRLGKNAPRDKIINSVRTQLRTREVVLVLRGIEVLLENHLGEIIQDFWHPLASQINQATVPNRLIMFLVDDNGSVKDMNISYIEALPDNASLEPTIPLRLPIIGRFSEQDLRFWRDFCSEHLISRFLPDTLMSIYNESMIQTILQKSDNGDPYLVMWHICEHCELPLIGVDKCLKF